MKDRVAWIFPGQGSQYSGMGRELSGLHRDVAELFRDADALLGFPLSEYCFGGPDSELKKTAVTQPAVLTVSVGAMMLLKHHGLKPDFTAGHSLGEYTALVAAGALDFAEALTLVRKRGIYMQEAVPEGQGAMAAVIGLEMKAVTDLCRRAARGDVVCPANHNAPDQVVVAGHAEAVERLMRLAEEEGARRVIALEVSAPFHCPLMEPAAKRLARELDLMRFRDPAVPVICNARADELKAADEVRVALRDQVASPVLWSDSVERLVAAGVETFVELGPGRILSGLVRRISRKSRLLNVEDEKSLNRTVEALKEDA